MGSKAMHSWVRMAKLSSNNPWRPIALTFALSFALRVAIACWLPHEVVWPDGFRYIKVADTILSGHGFGDMLDNRYSVPTQPLLIAAIWFAFGKSYLALRLFFATLGAVTCTLAYVLAKRLFDPVTAFIAAVLVAVYPYFIYLSALFEFPQTFFLFVMSVFFALLYEFFHRKRLFLLFFAGFCLGLGILSVPTAMIFAPLLVLTLWSGRLHETLVRAVVLTIAVCLPVAAWTIRNYIAYDELILVNKGAGFNFWIANNDTYFRFGKKAVVPPCAVGFKDTSLCRDFDELENRIGSGLSEKAFIAAHEAESWANGLRFVRETPGKFAILAVRKQLEFWSPNPDALNSGLSRGGAARGWIAMASYGPILVLAVIGVINSRTRWRQFAPIYAYVLAFSATYCIFLPTTRYRLPLDFFLIIFAAYAIARFFQSRKANHALSAANG